MQLITGIQKTNWSLEDVSKGFPETRAGTSLTIHTLGDKGGNVKKVTGVFLAPPDEKSPLVRASRLESDGDAV